MSAGHISAREALRACLPEPLRDNTFANLLKASRHLVLFARTIAQPILGRHSYKAMLGFPARLSVR